MRVVGIPRYNGEDTGTYRTGTCYHVPCSVADVRVVCPRTIAGGRRRRRTNKKKEKNDSRGRHESSGTVHGRRVTFSSSPPSRYSSRNHRYGLPRQRKAFYIYLLLLFFLSFFVTFYVRVKFPSSPMRRDSMRPRRRLRRFYPQPHQKL